MTVASAMLQVIGESALATLMRFVPLSKKAPNIPSPKVRAGWNDWKYTYDVNTHTGTLTVKNLPPVYAISPQDTRSMLPVAGTGHLVMMTKDFKVGDLEKGDGVMYRKPEGSNFHTIAGVFEDSKGKFFICKGANCFWPDPFSIRPSEVVSVMRAIIY